MLWEWRKEVLKYKKEEKWIDSFWKPRGKIRWALIYPNAYSVGISNLGFLFVYRVLSEIEDIFVSRFFKWKGFPPLSFEEGKALPEFDVIAFSLSYELDLPNLVAILREGGISPLREKRKEEDPLVGVGGAFASLNPLPLFPIADFIVCGEAEESLKEIAEIFLSSPKGGKKKLLERLATIEGVLVPGIKEHTRRRWVKELDLYPSGAPLYTSLNEFGGALLVELNRGCKRNCFFVP